MKPTELASWFEDERLAEQVPSTLAKGLQGSAILAIAGHVTRLRAEGHAVSNFTIGDFDPSLYAVPDALRDGITRHLAEGQTHYPPAVGVPELRAAVRSAYRERLGLDYPEGCVQVGAGARPPIYAAFRCVLDPGDVVVYPVPTWNVRYYCELNGAEGVPVVTDPERGFMPTAADLAPHLARARMVVLNSPLNPCGTVIARELLLEICEAIVAENRGRLDRGERPVILLYDQVYWQLTFEGNTHHTPVGLVPEMARYTVLVDAISKCWAATGLRVGWAVLPPYLQSRTKPLVGHMGAWAARAEQRATADLLTDDEAQSTYLDAFSGRLRSSLHRLRDGLRAMAAEGLPVRCLDAQGAIYLSARFDLIGRTVRGRRLDDDEAVRSLLLEEAGVAVVPFTAFGYPDGTGWVRFSVGSVDADAIDGALERIGALLRDLG